MNSLLVTMGTIANWKHVVPVAIIAGVGALLSVAAFLLVADWERQGVQAEFERSAKDRIAALKSEVNANLELLHSLKSLFLAAPQLDRNGFGAFATHFLARHKTIQALEWIPRVPAAKRDEYQAAARRAGHPEFRFTERRAQGEMVPVAARDEYYPVYFVEPLAGNEQAFGFDLGSEPTRLEALMKARDTGKAVATARITLVQETQQQSGFLVFLPVYDTDLGDAPVKVRREALVGFTLGVFRLRDIVEQSFGDAAGEWTDFEFFLFDRSASPGDQVLYSNNSGITSPAQLAGRNSLLATVDAGGRDWLIVVAQIPGAHSGETFWEPLAVLIIGLLVSALLSAYLQKILSQRAEIETTVTERTEQLSQVNATLRDSEARHAEILTSAADGIITIDEMGIIESFNPSAETTFGYSQQQVLGRNISMLMPSPYTDEHDRYLSAYRTTGVKKIIGAGRQVTGLRKSGEEFPMDLSVNEMHLAGRRLFTGIVRDLTERFEAEEALKESEGALVRLREKQTLSELQASWNARIEAYHEFVHTVGNLITPARIKASALANESPAAAYLAELRSRVELFTGKLETGDLEGYLRGEGKNDLPQFVRGLELLEELSQESEKDLKAIEIALTRVIETTTAQSRLQKTIAETTEVDLVTVVEGVLNLLQDNWRQKGITWAFPSADKQASQPAQVLIRADKVRLFNTIHNVLKNAGEAFVGIEADNPRIEISLTDEGEKLILEVRDNGRGLNADELARVGQIGFSTKDNSGSGEGGSGLGLHGCRIFMAGIGGRCELTSEGPGKGATATITFPARVKA